MTSYPAPFGLSLSKPSHSPFDHSEKNKEGLRQAQPERCFR